MITVRKRKQRNKGQIRKKKVKERIVNINLIYYLLISLILNGMRMISQNRTNLSFSISSLAGGELHRYSIACSKNSISVVTTLLKMMLQLQSRNMLYQMIQYHLNLLFSKSMAHMLDLSIQKNDIKHSTINIYF